jgi:hypothetical protein
MWGGGVLRINHSSTFKWAPLSGKSSEFGVAVKQGLLTRKPPLDSVARAPPCHFTKRTGRTWKSTQCKGKPVWLRLDPIVLGRSQNQARTTQQCLA